MEPKFEIRARDRGAPEAVLEWIKIASAHGAPTDKLAAAFTVYLSMVTWQRDNPAEVHVPD